MALAAGDGRMVHSYTGRQAKPSCHCLSICTGGRGTQLTVVLFSCLLIKCLRSHIFILAVSLFLANYGYFTVIFLAHAPIYLELCACTCYAGPKLYCLVTTAHRCEQLAQSRYTAALGRRLNSQPLDRKSIAPPCHPSRYSMA